MKGFVLMCPIFQEDKEKDNARIKFRCDTGSSTRVASSPVSSPVRWVKGDEIEK